MVRIVKIVLLLLAVFVLAGIVLEKNYPAKEVKFGVTFSPRYARYLKLDWKKTYLSLLSDLKVKDLRIPTYWDILQKEPDKYDFSETDFMLDEAQKRNAKVILVVGEKQPRWPECFVPAWAKKLSADKRYEKILEFTARVVERYENYPAVWAWQVENEPFLPWFGEGCDIMDKTFIKREISLVRSLSKKKVIMTDSGELGFWATPMSFSDIFGTTLYREVYDKWAGYVTYPLPPYFYSLKSDIIRKLFAPNNNKTIVIELQAEPWLADGVFTLAGEQAELFPVSKMANFIDYAKKTGFDDMYLWGVEWWYFMDKHGYPQYLEYAKTLFK